MYGFQNICRLTVYVKFINEVLYYFKLFITYNTLNVNPLFNQIKNKVAANLIKLSLNAFFLARV